MKKNIYKINNIVTGYVTGIEKYGVFVNLDSYYSGLIHISEISNSFVRNINDYVKVGETIKVKILDIDEESSHVKLSIKGFDYRIDHKNCSKIIETKTGFANLRVNLEKWIKKKEKEILLKKN